MATTLWDFISQGLTGKFPAGTFDKPTPEQSVPFYEYTNDGAAPASFDWSASSGEPVALSKPARQDFPGLLPAFQTPTSTGGPPLPPSSVVAAPSMQSVTSNPELLALQSRMDNLDAIREGLKRSPITSASQAADIGEQTGYQQGYSTNVPRAPEPIMPSRAAQTGAYGSSAYQSDRNARLAILNEQERNRQPVPALPEHTINLDNLPDALKQVYAQRAANDAKRAAMVNPMDGNTIRPVAKTAGEKAARASEYEAAGLAVPAVFAPIASPEKVRADKQRRAEEEAYRQGNWSMQEQARAMSRKLGINPLLATAMVSDRMQQGAPVTGNGEPRMPDSWEPRLREGANDGLTGDIMQSALLGPQGAAMVRRQEVENQGGLDRINAQRGGMSPEQMAGLTTARAMIESGDPMAVQQGIQMARQLLGGSAPGGQMQNAPAPGTDPNAAHAVANNYQNPKVDQIVDSEFSSSNMAEGFDFWNPWNQDSVNEFANRAANRLAKELGVPPDAAMNYVKQWYQRKKNNSYFGYGFPDIGPSMAPGVGGRRDVLTMPAQ